VEKISCAILEAKTEPPSAVTFRLHPTYIFGRRLYRMVAFVKYRLFIWLSAVNFALAKNTQTAGYAQIGRLVMGFMFVYPQKLKGRSPFGMYLHPVLCVRSFSKQTTKTKNQYLLPQYQEQCHSWDLRLRLCRVYFLSVVPSLVVSSSEVDCLERLVSKMTYYVPSRVGQ